MYTAQMENNGPFSIRYPRGQGVYPKWQQPFEAIEIGKGRKICDGEDVAILSIGTTGNFVKKACSELSIMDIHPAHYDMRFVKPLDEDMLHEVFTKFKKIVTIEDGCLPGGFGSSILEFMADHGYVSKVIRLGIPDRYIEHGEPYEQHKECGYDAENIVKTVLSITEHAFRH